RCQAWRNFLHGVGSFSILPIGTYATSANFHQPRDTTDRCSLAFLTSGRLSHNERIQPALPAIGRSVRKAGDLKRRNHVRR
ncbi:MAG: hypothetical protein ACREJ5_01525, partial [Geminicoccaceae bacterium]